MKKYFCLLLVLALCLVACNGKNSEEQKEETAKSSEQNEKTAEDYVDVNKGLQRRLPPPMEEEQDSKDSEINERDIMEVKINWENKLLVEGELLDVRELRAKAKEFVDPAITGENMPVVADTILPEPFGKQPIKNKHVISLQPDRETSYQAYLEVQNELVVAYNELREECAKKYYGKSFVELEEAEQKHIEAIYPIRISEAEPRCY